MIAIFEHYTDKKYLLRTPKKVRIFKEDVLSVENFLSEAESWFDNWHCWQNWTHFIGIPSLISVTFSVTETHKFNFE